MRTRNEAARALEANPEIFPENCTVEMIMEFMQKVSGICVFFLGSAPVDPWICT